jgi:hypothetical protein
MAEKSISLVIEESDRQLMLLALAELALSRPGFNATLVPIAELLAGQEMFEEFKRINADRVKASHGEFGLGPALSSGVAPLRGRVAGGQR